MYRVLFTTKKIIIYHDVRIYYSLALFPNLFSIIIKNYSNGYILCNYVFSDTARYKYNHEILKSDESYFEGQHIPKGRRISVICRSEPDPKLIET
jgi:hypothetical protein